MVPLASVRNLLYFNITLVNTKKKHCFVFFAGSLNHETSRNLHPTVEIVLKFFHIRSLKT